MGKSVGEAEFFSLKSKKTRDFGRWNKSYVVLIQRITTIYKLIKKSEPHPLIFLRKPRKKSA